MSATESKFYGDHGYGTNAPTDVEELWTEIRKLRERVRTLESKQSHQHIFEVPRYAEGKRLRTEGAREYEPATNPGHS